MNTPALTLSISLRQFARVCELVLLAVALTLVQLGVHFDPTKVTDWHIWSLSLAGVVCRVSCEQFLLLLAPALRASSPSADPTPSLAPPVPSGPKGA